MYNQPWHRHSRIWQFCSGILIALPAIVSQAATEPEVVTSPDGNIVITFEIKELAGLSGCPVYSVAYKGRTIISDSRLGLALKGALPFQAGFQIARVVRSSRQETWSPVYGERKTIPDNYNYLIVLLQEAASPARRLSLTFRAYNEGAAFCYTIPDQNSLGDFVISAEKTQFRFTADHTAWAVYSAQGRYDKVTLSKIKDNCVT